MIKKGLSSLVICLVVSLGWANSYQATLKEKVIMNKLNRSKVFLFDVLESPIAFDNICLGFLPNYGRSIRISKRMIQNQLQEKNPFWKVDGPDYVTVYVPSQIMKAEKQKEELEQFIQTQLQQEQGKKVYHLNNYFNDIDLPIGKASISIQTNAREWIGVVPFQMLFFVDDQCITRRSISIRFNEIKTIAIAARTLLRDDIITENDIFFQEQEIHSSYKQFFYQKESLIGKKVQTRIPAQTEIVASMVAIKAQIERGQVVNIKVINDTVELLLDGKALENGNIGEKIMVRVCKTGKVLACKVIDDHLVELNL